MPELPEVEAFRRCAMDVVEGETLVSVWAADDPKVIEGMSARTLVKRLQGRRVIGSGRRGKLLWFELDARPWPLFHFAMTGSFVAVGKDEPRPRFCKLEMEVASGRRLAYINIRRWGRVRLRESPAHEPPVSELGFDPLLDLPALEVFGTILQRRRAPIKALLLDQKVFAGVGNWIADEVLYQAKVAPMRPAASLVPAEVKKLRTTLLRVVKKAVDVNADAASFPKAWIFHARWGKQAGIRTVKGERIVFDVVAGRTTAWVPSVQR